MIQKFSRNDRRALTFPAVHPCESVSPDTLLRSLITLSHSICSFQSNLFVTQRRNAREAVRQVGILLLYFEEIRDGGLSLPDSCVLCFTELHVTFQKIQFLLEDCAREGARLWMLMKCEFVATRFRELIQAVATAFDVMPLSSIDVGGEVQELVELVAKQARRAKLELDPDDERASRRVLFILRQLENRIEPDLSSLKQVLDYLEIRSWSDCNKEIKFLEEEIAFKCSDSEERESSYLSSLVGLACYSRGVIFEALDHRNDEEQSDAGCNLGTQSFLNPQDFKCPISLEIMTDPVTVSTGQTYDRSSIEKWLKAGNKICPKTGQKLTSSDLVPNSTLRKLIQQFCVNNGISLPKSGSHSRDDVKQSAVPGSPAAAQALRFLSKYLAIRLVVGTTEQKNKAAFEIRLLAKSNIFNRFCLIERGTIPPLLNLLSSTNASTQENAIAALLKLSKHPVGKKVIVEREGLSLILNVLKRGLSMEAREVAAATLFYLASEDEYRRLIGEAPEAIPDLVELIKVGRSCGKRNSLAVIFELLLHPRNHQKVLQAGAVPLVADILSSSDNSELVAHSLVVLATLAENVDGTHSILQTPSLPLVTTILRSSTSRSRKECCVSILLSLCINGGIEVVAALDKDPSLMPPLYSLLTDGTSHGGKKARSLLRILQGFPETNSSELICFYTGDCPM